MAGPDQTLQPLYAGRVLGGRYRLDASIARGGMAEVWEGYDDVLSRPVAVKVLRPHLAVDEVFRERFRREAVTAARLAHPGIVATFDTGVDSGVAFIVMELVRGRNLRQLLDHYGRLEPGQAVAITRQVADALAYAHGAGLVHRDVKPANILLIEDDAGGVRVKVTDFGIAKAGFDSGADLTRTGMVLGTPKYLSPEQIRGYDPDQRADLYSLGVVLYEMLVGAPPFLRDTDMGTALAHLSDRVPRPSASVRSIPGGLDRLVVELLAKSADRRIPTAAELRHRLDALGPMAVTGRRAERRSRRGSDRRPEPVAPYLVLATGPTVPYGVAAERGPAGPSAMTTGPVPTGAVPSAPMGWSDPAPASGGPDPTGASWVPATPAGPWPEPAGRPLPGPPTDPWSEPVATAGAGTWPVPPANGTPVNAAPAGPPPASVHPGDPPPPPPPPTRAAPPAPLGETDATALVAADPGDGATTALATSPTSALPRPLQVPPVSPRRAAPSPPAPPPSSRRFRRSERVAGLVVALLLVAVAAVAAVVLGGSHHHPASAGGSDPGSTPSTSGRSPVSISAVSVYMVNARPPDNAAETPLVFDGNPATSWSTDRYRNPQFGNLYPGIGLSVQLGGQKNLDTLTVTSPSSGWSASVYVSATPVSGGQAVSAWGSPTDSRSGISAGRTTFSLGGHKGGYVLLFITNLGPADICQISEISVG